MTRKSIYYLQKQKNRKKIICLSAYTKSIAKIIDNHVDMILIGDSLGTTIYGMKNTQGVTLDMMINHGKAVFNSSQKAFTIVDMPFNSYRNKKEALKNAKNLLKFTKCQSVKLETNFESLKIIKHLKENKITVISHIGVTPQKYKDFKKIRSVGKSIIEKEALIDLAFQLEKAGSSMIFLECVKESVANEITKNLKIPTIGIGASLECDGQVLVVNDILNTENTTEKPRFVKHYANINQNIESAVKKFSSDVLNKKFPKINNTY
jgi:3-methyl-2-oxobutanoate hydroxymethyltransferase